MAPEQSPEETSLRTPSEMLSVDTNGYPVGSVRGFAIDDLGDVTGYFSNGQRRIIDHCTPSKPPPTFPVGPIPEFPRGPSAPN